MQQNRAKEAEKSGKQSAAAVTATMDQLDLAQKKLDARVSKLSKEMNSKMDAMMKMVERCLTNTSSGGGGNNGGGEEYYIFDSDGHKRKMSGEDFSDGESSIDFPGIAGSSRSRRGSVESMSSTKINRGMSSKSEGGFGLNTNTGAGAGAGEPPKFAPPTAAALAKHSPASILRKPGADGTNNASSSAAGPVAPRKASFSDPIYTVKLIGAAGASAAAAASASTAHEEQKYGGGAEENRATASPSASKDPKDAGQPEGVDGHVSEDDDDSVDSRANGNRNGNGSGKGGEGDNRHRHRARDSADESETNPNNMSSNTLNTHINTFMNGQSMSPTPAFSPAPSPHSSLILLSPAEAAAAAASAGAAASASASFGDSPLSRHRDHRDSDPSSSTSSSSSAAAPAPGAAMSNAWADPNASSKNKNTHSNNNDLLHNAHSDSILNEQKADIVRIKPSPGTRPPPEGIGIFGSSSPSRSPGGFHPKRIGSATHMGGSANSLTGPPVELAINAINQNRMERIRAASAGRARKEF
jgi:hypothetical protein